MDVNYNYLLSVVECSLNDSLLCCHCVILEYSEESEIKCPHAIHLTHNVHEVSTINALTLELS